MRNMINFHKQETVRSSNDRSHAIAMFLYNEHLSMSRMKEGVCQGRCFLSQGVQCTVSVQHVGSAARQQRNLCMV